jgi:Flp pilus assembly protein TadB
VSLRLLYLILIGLHSWLTLLGRAWLPLVLLLRQERHEVTWHQEAAERGHVGHVKRSKTDVERPRGNRVDQAQEELHRLEESAKYSAQILFEAAKQWRGVNLLLGFPASVLAAVSGATALTATTDRIVAGVRRWSRRASGPSSPRSTPLTG